MAKQRLDRLLQECTVQIKAGAAKGTGFFVAPKLVLTCAHVVEKVDGELVEVFWKETQFKYTALVKQIVKDKAEDVDVALLYLQEDVPNHPCVYFDELEPELRTPLYTFGYSVDDFEKYLGGDSVLLEYEGLGFKSANLSSISLKLKEGQVKQGSSGSPLLNCVSGGVCGIIVRKRPNDLGGRAIPTAVIFRELPEIKEQSRAFHQNNRFWTNSLPKKLSNPIDQEYRTRASEFIYSSYIRSNCIDSRCEGSLVELRESFQRLGLLSEQAIAIESEIVRVHSAANTELARKVDRYQKQITGVVGDRSFLSDEDRELIEERQKSVMIEGEPAGIVFCLLGNELMRKGNLAKACAYFKESIRLKGDEPSPYVGLGTVLYKQGHITEAIEILNMAKSLYQYQPRKKRQHSEIEQMLTLISRKRSLLTRISQWFVT